MHGWLIAACAALGGLALPAPAVAGPDFNGDGRSDVLWRQADGQPLAWLMNGLGEPIRQSAGTVPAGTWTFLGTGNFNGAGSDDLLLISSIGTPFIWYFTAGWFEGACVVANAPSAGTTFAGIGDIDGDGKADVFWRGPDGRLSAWVMNSCSVVRQIALGPVPLSSRVVTVADVDGDGKADLLLRDAAGQYSVWLLDGNGVRTSAALSPAIAADWRFDNAADFNADGKADLVWRLPDGSLRVSLMDGAAHTDVAIMAADPDPIFLDGFDASGAVVPGAAMAAGWKLVDIGDYDGDGHPDLMFADDRGYVQVWQMSGTTVLAAVLWPPSPDMPYPGITGWVGALERPVVTQVEGQVTVTWPAVAGIAAYTLHASARNNPAATGTPIAVTGTSFTYARNDPAHSDKRYFSVSTELFGRPTPPSPEAYLLEFNQIDLPYMGAMSIADINGDGCIDILGALGDCRGGFSLFPEADMGLGALRANGRAWRDLRLADFNGDGIDDIIANVYTSLGDGRSRVLLFWGLGNGQFVEDAAFAARGIGGYGETVVVADFDNDGSLDVFLPNYTHHNVLEQNYLLINDGNGNFTEMADAAGVAMRSWPLSFRVEGAQAVDLDGDGRIDLYVGSHLFMNRTTQPGQPVFVDQAASRGLPMLFDEGAKFIDWNNDGLLDLLLHGPMSGPQLWQSTGNGFRFVNAMPSTIAWNASSGLNAADLDGDGRPDLMLAGGCTAGYTGECSHMDAPHVKPWLLLNRGSGYVHSDYYDDGIASDFDRTLADLHTVADFDGNGALDVAVRYPVVHPITGISNDSGIKILVNRANSPRAIHVTVLGAAGERNQHGRVVRVSPLAKPGFVMTDVVDGGSGYMANTAYTLQFAAPWLGAYRIEVRLADRLVEVTARAGDKLVIRADGQVSGSAGAATVTLLPPAGYAPVPARD